MASSKQPQDGVIAPAVRCLIEMVYWLSPYHWLDEYYKRREHAIARNSPAWETIRYQRYVISDYYILGWLAGSMLAVLFAKELPVWFAFFFLLRIIDILNKELGVVLFGICKITEGRAISTAPRVVILALVNYATLALLFACTYQEITPPLLRNQALIQAFSVSLALGPAFPPGDDCQWLVVLLQGAVCFMFLGVVISQFVSLLQLDTVIAVAEGKAARVETQDGSPPTTAKDSESKPKCITTISNRKRMNRFETLSLIISALGLLAILVLIYQARQASRSLQGSARQTIDNQMLELDKLLIDHPDLRPYFYSGKSIGEQSAYYQTAMALAEFKIDFLASFWTQADNIPDLQHDSAEWRAWNTFASDSFKASPVMCQRWREMNKQHWYTESFASFVADACH